METFPDEMLGELFPYVTDDGRDCVSHRQACASPNGASLDVGDARRDELLDRIARVGSLRCMEALAIGEFLEHHTPNVLETSAAPPRGGVPVNTCFATAQTWAHH
jgi:hypothetical protein